MIEINTQPIEIHKIPPIPETTESVENMEYSRIKAVIRQRISDAMKTYFDTFSKTRTELYERMLELSRLLKRPLAMTENYDFSYFNQLLSDKDLFYISGFSNGKIDIAYNPAFRSWLSYIEKTISHYRVASRETKKALDMIWAKKQLHDSADTKKKRITGDIEVYKVGNPALVPGATEKLAKITGEHEIVRSELTKVMNKVEQFFDAMQLYLFSNEVRPDIPPTDNISGILPDKIEYNLVKTFVLEFRPRLRHIVLAAMAFNFIPNMPECNQSKSEPTKQIVQPSIQYPDNLPSITNAQEETTKIDDPK